MARGHVILFPVKHHLAAQFVCPCLILAGQHLEQSVVSHTITHGFQADGAVNPSVARIDYPTITARQYKSASLSVCGFMPGVSISPPLIEAPMQIARSTVLVVQPVENASLQQRLLYEAVGKLTLREDTGVEPHLIACLLAFAVEAMAVSIVVQLRHPDVKELSQVVGVAGFDGWNLWCQGLEETAYVQIGGRIGGDGFVSDMLIVYLVPSFFAQMGGQGWDEMPQIVLRPLVFDGKQAAYPRHSYAKRIVPSPYASAGWHHIAYVVDVTQANEKESILYIDGVKHQATLMNVVMAETGAGKSCIDKPIQAIMADIAARDKANLAREKAWKDEVNSKGANKDKAKRPEGLVIQQIDADMTNAAFVMRLEESEGHFLYLKINEIQQLDALKGNGKGGQQFQIICLAFDPDSEYGQTRVGTQSISARVQVLFNFNACTTVNKGRQYFRNVLVDGPISRINFCTIPEQPIGSPIPKYGKYDAQFSEELKPFIDNLCAARGEIFCPEAYRLAKKLDDELKQKAIESQNRTFENLSFRANVIAYLKACVLYVANGCKWEKSIEDFVRWSLNYDLWCKMEFFGDAITQANRYNGPSHNQPKSLLEDLPQVFSREDVKTLYIKKGMDTSKVAQTIRMWKHRNLIIELPDGTYKQLRYAA